MIFSGVRALLPRIQSGRRRAVAIGSLPRFSAIPSVPTFDEITRYAKVNEAAGIKPL